MTSVVYNDRWALRIALWIGKQGIWMATPHTPRSNRWERVPGANPDTPRPRTPNRVALPSRPVRVPGEEGGSRWPTDRDAHEGEVGAELCLGSHGWTIPKCTYEKQVGILPEAEIKYDLFLGQPWLTFHRVAPMGHRTCFLQDPSEDNQSELFFFRHGGPPPK